MNTLPEPEKSAGLPMGLIRTVAILLAIAAVLVSIMRSEPEDAATKRPKPPVAADFESSWRRAANADIARTLNSTDIDDNCPLFAYRAHKTSQGVYLVYCSNDSGRRWIVWVVYTAAQKALGPFPPDPLLPLPQ